MKSEPAYKLSALSTFIPALAGGGILFFVAACGAGVEQEVTGLDVVVVEEELVEPARDITSNEAVELIASEDGCVVLDIRTPEEYAEGHIAGARNINYRADEFKAELGKLDTDKAYIVHCGSGGRSTSSLPVFEELGFTKVYHLAEGLGAWEAEGKPLEK
jgi:phage shock protein E